MVIDAERCVGCQACTVACKTENQSPYDAWYAPVVEWEAGEYPDATLNYLPTLCNHCEDAPCVTACPSGALKRRDDGIVIADEDVCIGSRACMAACPYGAIHFHDGRAAVSGRRPRAERPRALRPPAARGRGGVQVHLLRAPDRLRDRERPGGGGSTPWPTPACVVTCPAECRIFGDLDDPDSNVSRYLADKGPEQVLRPDAKTGPSTRYVGLP